MPHAYTEDQLVEQPAIGLFAELGWQTVSAMEEVFGLPSPQPSPEGRGSVSFKARYAGAIDFAIAAGRHFHRAFALLWSNKIRLFRERTDYGTVLRR